MDRLTSLFPRFNKQKILVLGDLMVDRFVWGKVSRISRKLLCRSLRLSGENNAFGGAGNVANNITSLGASAFLLGVVGSDMEAEQLKDGLRAKNIDVEGIITDNARPTTIKTRIIAQHQQVVRVDKEVKELFLKAFRAPSARGLKMPPRQPMR